MKKYIIIAILISLTISITSIVNGIFPITFDQGRDWLWVKNQFDLGRPSLVGPAGSIRGVFFGPLWFWLLAIPHAISHGHPLAMTLFNALIVYLDWIYKDAGGQGFKLYTFVPSIYDYNWQYMIFWRGLNRYGHLPEEFSYWPLAQEYIPYKNQFLSQIPEKIKPAENLTYYILTTGSLDERSWWQSGSGYPAEATPSATLTLADGTIFKKFIKL